jgi:hypothetical protein
MTRLPDCAEAAIVKLKINHKMLINLIILTYSFFIKSDILDKMPDISKKVEKV